MRYIENESGEVKIIDEKGKNKWILKRLAQDKILMKTMKLTVVEAPVAFDGFDELKVTEKIEEKIKEELEQEPVAEATTAKRGRKPNK